MAEEVQYKFIVGEVKEVEAQVNELAKYGWRVVSCGQRFTDQIVVILEMATIVSKP